LTPQEEKQWGRYLDRQISQWLAQYRCLQTEDRSSTCSGDSLPQIEGKLINSAEELQIKLKSVGDYYQQLKTSPVYGNTRFDLVEPARCDLQDSADKINTSFGVASPSDPFRLLVTDACSREITTLMGAQGVLQAQIPLRDLLQPDSALSYFDQILIVDTKDRVLYRSGEEDVISLEIHDGLPSLANLNDFARFTDLSDLLAKARQPNGATKGAGSKNTSKTLTGTYSRIVEETVGDMPHLFFLQPIRPPIREVGAGEDKSWHVIGVVRKSQLLTDVSRVSLNVMAALILVMLLLLLAVPLLKLRFATVTEPISAAQVYLLGISLILGAGLATLILLDLRAYGGLKDRMDLTASHLSARMQTAFKQELESLIKANKDAFSASTLLDCDGEEKQDSRPDNPNKLPVGDTYPPWELAYLLDAEGRQVGCQRTYRSDFAEPIAVPNRQYFLRARDGPLWHRASSDDRFFLERIFTYDHGWWLTALSMPTTMPVTIEGHTLSPRPPRVRVTLKAMQSFFAAVLPPAFGFAVLEDASGRVIYHSDNSRSLLENFYVETDNNEHLFAAVRARRHEEITGNYYGEGHRFFVAPLADTAWSLVVFYDKTLLRTLNFEILISTATALVLYVLIIFIGLFLFRLLSRDQRWRFVWPRAAALREYRYLTAILLLSLILGLRVTLLPTGDRPWLGILPILALPLYTLSLVAFSLDYRKRSRGSTAAYNRKRILTEIALLFGLVAMSVSQLFSSEMKYPTMVLLIAVSLLILFSRAGQAYAPEQNHPGRERETRFWYLSCAMLVLVLVTVLPTKLLFDDIFSLQTEKLLRMSQHHVLQKVDEHRQAVVQDLHRITRETQNNAISSSDSEMARGIYPSAQIFDDPNSKDMAPAYKAELSKNPGDGNEGIGPAEEWHELYKRYPISILTENFPAYSLLSAWLHLMLFENASDNEWGAKTQEGGKQSYWKASAEGNDYYAIESDRIVQQGSADTEIQVSVYGGMVVLFFLLLFALRSIAQRVLGLDFPIIRTHWDLDDPEDWRGVRRIVLAPTPESVKKLKQHLQGLGTVREIDLSTGLDQQQLLDLAAQSDRTEHNVVILVSPKFFNCDRLTREQLLHALQRLDACSQTTLILCTDLFPWLNLALAGGELAQKDFSQAEKTHWQALLQRFISGYAKPDSMVLLTSIETLLNHECRHSELAEIQQSIEARPSFKRAVELQKSPWKNALSIFRAYFGNTDPDGDILTSAELIEEVTQRASDFHRALWQCCNQEEQYVLYRMAQGNMVNCLHTKLLEHLLRLGLLRKEPDFRIASYSLRNFILSEETPEEARAWEKQTDDSIWTYLRIPLLMLLLTLTVFLAYVGPNVIESLLGLIPAIVLALPLALRLFSRSGGS
jgi:hypothetical protein